MSSEVVELVQAMIRNACVNTGLPDSGHEHRSVATLQEFFGVQGEVFEPAPGRQSLVYRVAGTDPEAPSLALVPHIDVVPADPEGWTQDPFGGEIVDGDIYGRGAVDMLTSWPPPHMPSAHTFEVSRDRAAISSLQRWPTKKQAA